MRTHLHNLLQMQKRCHNNIIIKYNDICFFEMNNYQNMSVIRDIFNTEYHGFLFGEIYYLLYAGVKDINSSKKQMVTSIWWGMKNGLLLNY